MTAQRTPAETRSTSPTPIPPDSKYAFLVEVAAGLRAKPAYLLIFSVCALFLMSGMGTSIVGAVKGDHWLLGFGLASFVVALGAALLTVRLLERDHYVAPSYGDVHVLHSTKTESQTPSPVQTESATIMDSFPAELDACFASARSIVLFGVHQSHILIRYYELIRSKLARGDSFRVLIMDPNGHGVAMTTLRFPGPRRERQEVERIQSSIESFCELRKAAPERLEIRTFDFLFAYGGFLFDADEPTGCCFIQRYTFRVHGGPRKPKYMLTKANHADWFLLYHQEIEALWRAGQPIQCS